MSDGDEIDAPSAAGERPGEARPPAVRGTREAHRALVRIVTNYARLGLTLALGLAFVPFVLHWIGGDALGLIILLGAGVGLASMFREVTTRSVVRELSAAHHSGDDEAFRRTFNSALVVSALMAGVAGVVFAGLFFFLPLFKIPAPLLGGARVMLASQGAYVMLTTALSPIYNMLVVRERFTAFNFWSLAERSTLLISAVVLSLGFGVTDPNLAVSRWAVMVAALQSITFLIPVLMNMRADRRLRPSRAHASREGAVAISKTIGMYVAVELSNALYEKVGQFIINAFFGLLGNVVFGIAYQFVSYVRQATVGVTFGLDAVSARVSTSGGERPLRALMHHSTRLHGLAALPTGVAVFLLAEPLIRLWVGGRFADPERYIPGIVLTVQIMSISLTSRAIADGWLMILYGAGFLRRYAPLIVAGGVLFPPLVITLLKVMGAPANPSVTLYIVPATFCAVQFAIYCIGLPLIGARCLGIAPSQMFLPLWRPAFVTVLSAPVLVLVLPLLAKDPTRPGIIPLALTGALFGAVYVVLAMALVLTSEERQRFVWGPFRRLASQG